MNNNWEIHWKDYYQILQVHPTAEQEVIKAAYDRLARKYHPDVNQESSSINRMTEINEAFEVLNNLSQRRLYHPEWLKKRSAGNEPQEPLRASVHRENYKRQESSVTSTRREPDNHSESPLQPSSFFNRIPDRVIWIITLFIFLIMIWLLFNLTQC